MLSGLPDISVTVVDEDERRLVDAARTDPSVCRSPNLGDVFDQVDGVVVATPPASHAEVALRALCAGKHALVESRWRHRWRTPCAAGT
ncbi:MAG: Gfo/Idh/MocA family oxidoreductase [Pseudonocardiaceae bacterium]